MPFNPSPPPIYDGMMSADSVGNSPISFLHGTVGWGASAEESIVGISCRGKSGLRYFRPRCGCLLSKPIKKGVQPRMRPSRNSITLFTIMYRRRI